MNIRFSDGHIRFRVTTRELERLMAGRSLTLEVPMPRSHRFRATIGTAIFGDWQLDSDPTGIWLTLPRNSVQEFQQALPSKDGLQHEFILDGAKLTVSFEVDLRKQNEQQAA
jgi:hypothetical protein